VGRWRRVAAWAGFIISSMLRRPTAGVISCTVAGRDRGRLDEELPRYAEALERLGQ
jgi:hypothetical protein